MTEVWVRWRNGKAKRIDGADSEAEAINLLEEYRKQYGKMVKSIWLQEGPVA